MSNLDKQGEECRKLQAEFTAEGKTYNERRKAQKDALRVALTPVWAALKSGATVNGQKGLERWAEWFNPVAKYPLRQLQRVMNESTEKSETTSRRVKPLDLTLGMVLKIDKHRKITVDKTFLDMAKAHADAQREELKKSDRLFKFIGVRDFAKATKLYKAAIKEAHPDNGGDTKDAALVNTAWDEYKKQNGWSGPTLLLLRRQLPSLKRKLTSSGATGGTVKTAIQLVVSRGAARN